MDAVWETAAEEFPPSQNACPEQEEEHCTTRTTNKSSQGISTDGFCRLPLPCPVLRLEIQQPWADFYQALARHCKRDVLQVPCSTTTSGLLRLSEAGNALLLFAKSSREKMAKQHTQDLRNPNLLWSSLLNKHMTASCLTQWSERKSTETTEMIRLYTL